MKRKSLVTLFLIMTLLFVGCSSSDKPNDENVVDNEDKYNDETPFVATYAADFTSLAPLAEQSANTKQVLRNLHEGVYKYDTKGALKPGIAESIDVSVEDPYIVYDIKLKEGIKFHNGKTLTSEDVKYSYERLAGMVDGITSEMLKGAGYWEKLLNGDENKGKIEIQDDLNLKVYLDGQYGTLTSLHNIADGFIVPSDYSEDDQAKHPVGLGPYKFVEYNEGDSIKLERFEDYYGDKPEIKNVEFRIYADLATLPIAFESGEIDILDLTNQNYDNYKQAGYEITESLSNDVRILYMNQRPGHLFENKDLRYALNYAIDKEKILKTIANDRGAVLSTHMTPLLEDFYNDELDEYFTYDLDKAKEYLKKAGKEDGFEIDIKTVAEEPVSQDIVALIIEDLAKIGIKANNDQMPWNTYYEEVYLGYNYELTLLNLVGYPDPSRILNRYQIDSNGNLPGYNNPEYDSLIKDTLKEVDQEKIREDYKKLQKMLTEDAIGVFTVDPGKATVISKGYTGYENYPFAFIDVSQIKRK